MNRDAQRVREKAELRRSIKSAILSLDPSDRQLQESALAGLFPKLPGFASAQIVLLYVQAFPEELDTYRLIEHALGMDKVVACPRVDRNDRRLRIYRVSNPGADLGPGTLGIPEPRAHCQELDPTVVDWVLVPGLAFDLLCRRLGRGAGYYDRLLPRLRGDAVRWALGFDCQLVSRLPLEPHDIGLDGIATPGRIVVRDPCGSGIHGPATSMAGGSA
jgi:5-formyltetrahydrofolate cyclo-ligase